MGVPMKIRIVSCGDRDGCAGAGKRGKGGPKGMWMDNIRYDLTEK